MGEKRQYADCTQFEVLPDCALQKNAPLLFPPIAVWDQPHRAAPSHFFENVWKKSRVFRRFCRVGTQTCFLHAQPKAECFPARPCRAGCLTQPGRPSVSKPHAASPKTSPARWFPHVRTNYVLDGSLRRCPRCTLSREVSTPGTSSEPARAVSSCIRE